MLLVVSFEFSLDKKIHRFFQMDKQDFYFASGENLSGCEYHCLEVNPSILSQLRF
nr:hypothetical protein [Neobacillus sp. Marseille-Q6967]